MFCYSTSVLLYARREFSMKIDGVGIGQEKDRDIPMEVKLDDGTVAWNT
jgi:hypothetical protein